MIRQLRSWYRFVIGLLLGLALGFAVASADDLNTYMLKGDVHWVWCGDAANGTNGRFWIYPWADWAIMIECVPNLPERPSVVPVAYLPIIFVEGGE